MLFLQRAKHGARMHFVVSLIAGPFRPTFMHSSGIFFFSVTLIYFDLIRNVRATRFLQEESERRTNGKGQSYRTVETSYAYTSTKPHGRGARTVKRHSKINIDGRIGGHLFTYLTAMADSKTLLERHQKGPSILATTTQTFDVVNIIFYAVRNRLLGYQYNCSHMTTGKKHHCRQVLNLYGRLLLHHFLDMLQARGGVWYQPPPGSDAAFVQRIQGPVHLK